MVRVKMVPVRLPASYGGPNSYPTRDDLRLMVRLELVVQLPKRVDAVVAAVSRLGADETHKPAAVEAEYRKDVERELELGVSSCTYDALLAALPDVPELLRDKLKLAVAPYKLVGVHVQELTLIPAESFDPENLSHQPNLRALAQRQE